MFLHALLYDLEFTIKILNLTKMKCATIHPHLALPMRLWKQGYQKVASNFNFGSTYIVEPQDPKYLQQLGL
jgi:hypothetical protein